LWKFDPSLAWYSWNPTSIGIHAFNDFITVLLFWSLLFLSALIYYRSRRDGRVHEKGVFYLLCAWALFLLPTVSNYSFMFMSMHRYLFPVLVALVLANGESLVEGKTSSSSPMNRAWSIGVTALQIAIVIAGFVMQAIFVQRFTSWQWVASG